MDPSLAQSCYKEYMLPPNQLLRPERKARVVWILDVREAVSWLYQVGKAWYFIFVCGYVVTCQVYGTWVWEFFINK